MSGHVFHPGHAELHGVTVVVETTGDLLYIGRYHEESAAGVLLHDVAEHQAGPGAMSPEEFVRRTLKFGVRASHKNIVVPGPAVRRIVRLMDWGQG